MAPLILKILLTLYICYALVKFFDFFFLGYEARIRNIAAVYDNKARIIKIFDGLIVILVLLLVTLLFLSGIEYLSFTTGCWSGCRSSRRIFTTSQQPCRQTKCRPRRSQRLS
jgi:hypothetical protein